MTYLIIALAAFWDYSYEAVTGCGYNNNLFTYSREYIDDFMAQIRPYRFPFETYDDCEISQDLSFLLRNRLIKAHTSTLSARIRISHYLINKQKDHLWANLGLRQSFGKWAAKINYDLLPFYLIRYYRNPNGTSTDYKECRVDYHKIMGKISIFPTHKMAIQVAYTHMLEKYHEPFTLYNATDNFGSMRIEQRISRYLNFGFDYSFRASRSDTNRIIIIEDTPDRSYDQHNPGLDMVYCRRILIPMEITVGYQYKFRNYLSGIRDDLLHYSRQDHIHDLFTSISLRLRPGIKWKCDFERTWRKATSNYNDSIGVIKDYSQTRITGALIFYY